MPEDPSITIESLRGLRRATSEVALKVEEDLARHLETLASLLRPKLLLGDFIAGASAESRTGAEAARDELVERYAAIAPKPFKLLPRLETPIPAIRVRLETHPLEEAVQIGEGSQQLTVVFPFAWVLSYPGACTLGSLRAMLAGTEPRNEDEIRQFLLNCLILDRLIDRSPGVVALFAALRFRLETRRLPGLGDLPVPIVTSEVPSTRPPAQVMADAAELAGLSKFSEVIDVAAARRLQDPLVGRVEAALQGVD